MQGFMTIEYNMVNKTASIDKVDFDKSTDVDVTGNLKRSQIKADGQFQKAKDKVPTPYR